MKLLTALFLSVSVLSIVTGEFALATPEVPAVPASGKGIVSCHSESQVPGEGVALVVYEIFDKQMMLLKYETVMGTFKREFEGTLEFRETDIEFSRGTVADLIIATYNFKGTLFVRQPRLRLSDRNLICKRIGL